MADTTGNGPKKKKPYEPPKLFDLGSGVAYAAAAACKTGGSPAGDMCQSGSVASTAKCQTGSAAGGSCHQGGAAAGGKCQSGSVPA